MRIIRYLHEINIDTNGCVATIGNFDGIHLGHQALLQQLHVQAKSRGLPLVVITFEPHPKEFFHKEKPFARLTRFREKVELLKQYHVDQLLCLRFNNRLMRIPAEEFIKEVLITKLHVKYLLVGKDFRFGYQRTGDFKLLQQATHQYHFELASQSDTCLQQQKISSSYIRESLAKGDMQHASALLGRPYTITGRVVHGDKRGRALGYPTANIVLSKNLAITGIFAVTIDIANQSYRGVASIGYRPMFKVTKGILEVYIFDFDSDIYGRKITIEFLHKLRDEQTFDSLDLLQQQIQQDISTAKSYFAKTAKA